MRGGKWACLTRPQQKLIAAEKSRRHSHSQGEGYNNNPTRSPKERPPPRHATSSVYLQWLHRISGRARSSPSKTQLIIANGMLAPTASALTAKRLRAHGLMLALSLWSVYLWNITTPGLLDRARNLKGTDFLHFYTLGSLALAHRGTDLYSLEAQSELAAQRVPAAAGIRYLPLYPPQVSIFFVPFARLSYPSALILLLALSALIYGLCCYAVWRACPNLRSYKTSVFILPP